MRMIRIISSRSKSYLNSLNSNTNLVRRAFSNRNTTSDANGGGSNSTGNKSNTSSSSSSNKLVSITNTTENDEKTTITSATTTSTTGRNSAITSNSTAGTTLNDCANNDNHKKQRIPLLDMSPYLDPVTFCKSSSTYDSSNKQPQQRTMDGTLAAKRLNQGKQMVRDLIAYQLCSYYHPNKKQQQQQQQCSNEEYILANLRNTKRKRRRQSLRKHSKVTPQPFIISGHGIPKQLLKDHLNLCSQIISHLQREQIMTGGECFFHHSHNTTTNNSNNSHTNTQNNDTTGGSTPIILHVRNKGDKNKVISWPFSNTTTNNGSFQDRLELYLTVMNRISSTLVQIMLKTTETMNYDKIPHELLLQPRKQYPSYWNVHFAVKEDTEENCDLYATSTTDTTLYSDLSYRDPPLVIAQLSVRNSSNSNSTPTNSKYQSPTISNTTNVRIQIHGRECKDESMTKATNSQVSVIYEACFFFQ